MLLSTRMGQAGSTTPQQSAQRLPGSLSATPIIGILRKCPPSVSADVATAAYSAGIAVLEVTLDSESALEQIETLRRSLPDADIGAGSVRTIRELTDAIDAGATFIVSPIVEANLITTCLRLGVPVIPGAATPTEIDRAIRLGAAAVKVFPASLLGGPGFVRAVLSPLGSPPLIPTGGVGVDNAGGYLDAGAVAVGVGSTLFTEEALHNGDAVSIRSMAADLVAAVTRS